ncbi:MAG: undecaprenyldiphospho-muramoylpentapeptide beta-N-acetylglucosaminyltransferase [Candidatus Aminicenantes bacterium]|nr:undecaprenyldiphospho-muramoylpentapeptide beta-N-acetylglucosaminyltransferase [Candidatus Aminicenantes bacterium]
METRRIVISGGGTGGHLYPALVLAAALREIDPDLQIVHVGSKREAERRIMAAQGVRFVALPIEGLAGGGWKALAGLVRLPAAFLKSYRLLRRLKPGLVVGVGSFSSGPIVWLASRMGLPTLIMEQNVRPGLTNRRLAARADKAVVAFEETLASFPNNGVLLGNPVRPEFAALPRKARTDRLSILVFGGSQGSRVLNRAVANALPLLTHLSDRLEIAHQTGPAGLNETRRAYAENRFERAVVEPYFDDMPARFGRADLVIARAGATTCAELIASRRASLLVPFAGAAEGHQSANAEALRAAGGAEVIEESELTPLRLAECIRRFLSHPQAQRAMEDRLAPLARPDAARRIADLCLALMAGEPKE